MRIFCKKFELSVFNYWWNCFIYLFFNSLHPNLSSQRKYEF